MIIQKPKKENNGYLGILSQVLLVHHDMIPDRGEDAYVLSSNLLGSVFGVFDGCGGAGAMTYEKMYDLTGAYLAAHLTADTVRRWFAEWSYKIVSSGKMQTEVPDISAMVKQRIDERLAACRTCLGTRSRIKGDLTKELPTTAAFTTVLPVSRHLQAVYTWSGDSRGYILDAAGMHQITKDDLEDADAYTNLTADGQMKNVISASVPYELHSKAVRPKLPCILLNATDGCFGYYSTPMEFEYLLLETMAKSHSVDEWQKKIDTRLLGIAGDDYTLCAAILGFRSFAEVQTAFRPRLEGLEKDYIGIMREAGDAAQREQLWQRYRTDYEKYEGM